MTLRAVGIPDLVELLRHPAVAGQPIATARDLANVLEWAAQQKWPQGHLTHAAPAPGSPDLSGFMTPRAPRR